MIHITDKVKELIKHWSQCGFNDVMFDDLYLEEQRLDDMLADGFTEEDYNIRAVGPEKQIL